MIDESLRCRCAEVFFELIARSGTGEDELARVFSLEDESVLTIRLADRNDGSLGMLRPDGPLLLWILRRCLLLGKADLSWSDLKQFLPNRSDPEQEWQLSESLQRIGKTYATFTHKSFFARFGIFRCWMAMSGDDPWPEVDVWITQGLLDFVDTQPVNGPIRDA